MKCVRFSTEKLFEKASNRNGIILFEKLLLIGVKLAQVFIFSNGS
jgi:hypothetical protein